MPHFQRSNLPKYHAKLSRDILSRQLLKICYGYRKGFSKAQGICKAEPVANEPGRFICKKCVDKLIRGDPVKGMSMSNSYTKPITNGLI